MHYNINAVVLFSLCKSMQCSPASADDDNFTCFNYDQLKKIAMNYNKQQTNKKNKIIVSKDKKKLWKSIHKKMKAKCNDDESCWVEQQDVIKTNFRPKAPHEWKKNPRTWLSNFDIDKVLKQYEDKYPTFMQIGVFPSNYNDLVMGQCVSQELCNLNVIDLLSKRKYQLGIVFNLDPHYMSGSHWVAIYINIDPKSQKFGFYYYDSNAEKQFSYVDKLYDSIKTQLKSKTNKEFNLHVNTNKHQFKNTECGMFSINFIVEMLKRKNKFTDVVNRNIDDEYVFKLRKKYFN